MHPRIGLRIFDRAVRREVARERLGLRERHVALQRQHGRAARHVALDANALGGVVRIAGRGCGGRAERTPRRPRIARGEHAIDDGLNVRALGLRGRRTGRRLHRAQLDDQLIDRVGGPRHLGRGRGFRLRGRNEAGQRGTQDGRLERSSTNQY